MSDLVERLRGIRAYNGGIIVATQQAADRIEALEHDLTAALREATTYAREAGEAKGRLEGSEMAGVVEGWQRKCERLKTALRRIDSQEIGGPDAEIMCADIARQALEQNR